MKSWPKNIQWSLSQKSDGAMNLRVPAEENCLKNRKAYFSKIGIDINSVVSAGLVHGTNIRVVNENDKGKLIPETDGLITNRRSVFLTVTVGDCAPIYFFDGKKRIIGLAHAGWRGVVKNISKSLVSKMITDFKTNPKDIYVYIGPHLKKCHFEIKEDIVSQFRKDDILKENGIMRVDLFLIIKRQLLSLGVMSKNINSSDDCTFCGVEKYFSYRRDKPDKAQSMVAYIGML